MVAAAVFVLKLMPLDDTITVLPKAAVTASNSFTVISSKRLVAELPLFVTIKLSPTPVGRLILTVRNSTSFVAPRLRLVRVIAALDAAEK